MALVAPSGPVNPARLDAGIEVLRSWGLAVREMPHVRTVHPVHTYLAGSDEERAADFTAAWLDDEVQAVFCVRGGYGAHRMVDRIDWAALAGALPKVLVGYSDVTALHDAVGERLNVVTLHGPMTSTGDFLDHPNAQAHLRATLFEPETVMELTNPAAHVLVGGRARGVTTGGCVSVIATSTGLAGSRRGTSGALVMLEDTNEDAYRLDSYLTYLRRSGWFDGAAGIALGSWADCEPAEPVVVDVLGDLGIPILGELGFGHGPSPLTIPLGVAATLDADAGTLTLDEPALA